MWSSRGLHPLRDGAYEVLGDQSEGGEGVFTGAGQGIQVLSRDSDDPVCDCVRRAGNNGAQVSYGFSKQADILASFPGLPR